MLLNYVGSWSCRVFRYTASSAAPRIIFSCAEAQRNLTQGIRSILQTQTANPLPAKMWGGLSIDSTADTAPQSLSVVGQEKEDVVKGLINRTHFTYWKHTVTFAKQLQYSKCFLLSFTVNVTLKGTPILNSSISAMKKSFNFFDTPRDNAV